MSWITIPIRPIFLTVPRVQMEARYWAKIRKGDKKECWLWIGAINSSGYGQLDVQVGDKRRKILAHRLGYLLATDREPGPVVRHLCNNTICNNPNHLADGTQKDNRHDWSPLSQEIVDELRAILWPTITFRDMKIRLRPALGERQKVAKALGTTIQALEHIASGITWIKDE